MYKIPLTFWRKKYIYDIIIAVTIVLLPFVIFGHLLFEESSDYVEFFGLKYAHGYDDIRSFVWHLMVNLIPTILFTFWYLNTYYWWRYFIFAPILFYIDYLIRSIITFNPTVEEHNIPVSIVVCIVTFYIIIIFKSKKISDYGRARFSIFGKDFLVRRNSYFFKNIGRGFGKKSASRNKTNSLFLVRILLEDLIGEFRVARRHKVFRYFDVLVILILLSVPIIGRAHHAFDHGIQIYEIAGFTIDGMGFADVRTFFWYVGTKLCIILPMCLWFVTCQHWWRYSILSPIFFAIYQLLDGLRESTEQVDEMELIRSFPVIFIVVLILLLVSRIARYNYGILDLHAQIAGEIDDLLATQVSDKSMSRRRELEKLKSAHGDGNPENLKQLVALKEALQSELKNYN